ncbi:MAG: hypothetical protein HZA23_01920, partial [Nitrospirae bacterium]|nr:hypothetical protein [Nitrospirota bacterium]
GKGDTIDFDRVKKEWKYNVEVGKAIFDDATTQANKFFTRLGVEPTPDQLAKESYFLYNHSPGFWLYDDDLGRLRWVEYHYYEMDPTTGKLVKKDYAPDPDFDADEEKGARDAQRGADRYWDHLNDKTWTNPETPPC